MIFVFTFVLVAILLAVMSVGVLLGREPIKGSCGGMEALGLDTACDICGGDPAVCDEGIRNDTGSGVNVYAPAVDKS